MSVTSTATHVAQTDAVFIQRRFTTAGQDVWASVEWGTRDVMVGSFSQEQVEAPVSWSDVSVGIVAKIYFATIGGEREKSVKQLIKRVVEKICEEGARHGYFGKTRADREVPSGKLRGIEFENHEFGDAYLTFRDELIYILLHQMAAFNTPVWLNLGVPGRSQVCSACFLLSVKDTMVGAGGITEWWQKEAIIFKNGAGSGINVATLRASMEPLSTGGLASGPCAYMRTADSGAGTLKSGGAHRRAAKMVCMDVDHPDIMDFIQLKVREDDRMRALVAAGFNLDPTTPEGERLIAECTTCQNANFSVRLSDAFMQTVEENGPWGLIARKSKEVIDNVDAKSILASIAETSWRCADPGLLFDDTINDWHTTPSRGRITTCNPCAEVHQNDDTACNLSSINLLKFVAPGATHFSIAEFTHVVDVMTTAMDITCSFSDLPTEEIKQNVRDMRQLGLGYCNLGAALMVQRMPYDSIQGRNWAESVTSLMTARCYARSVELADQLGPFKWFSENRKQMLGVLTKHRDAAEAIVDGGEISRHACDEWARVLANGEEYGFRNSQATVLAPTGTISFLMGADTTGVEPSIGLVSHKGLASGGTIKMVNGSVEQALDNLHYSKDHVANIMADLRLHETSGMIRPEHRPIFATAFGDNTIAPIGHLLMVAAVQPHISGAPSKTVNMPEETTVEEIESLYLSAWKMGIKALAIYREGSKATSVLTVKKEQKEIPTLRVEGFIKAEDIPTNVPREEIETLVAEMQERPARKRLPAERNSLTHKFSIDGHEGYIHAGMWPDGTLGEIFISGFGKEGSTIKGMTDVVATAISISLQYGVPLETYARKFTNMNFEPHGITSNPEIMSARSIVDYIMRWLVSRFGDEDLCEELGVLTPAVKKRLADKLNAGGVAAVPGPIAVATVVPSNRPAELTGPVCRECGNTMKRTGTCFTCSCGNNTGCG